MEATASLYGLLAVVPLMMLLAAYVSGPKLAPGEPPLVSPTIPIVGHLIGMMRKRTQYLVDLQKRYKLPIYTISIFGAKLYIVGSVDLVNLVQRQSKVLDFRQVSTRLAGRVCNSSPQARKIVEGSTGESGLITRHFNSNHAKLAAGPDLDAMNRETMNRIAAILAQVDAGELPLRIDLFDWVQHLIIDASFTGTHGPDHPLRDRKAEAAYWSFDQNILFYLLCGDWSRVLIPKLHAAREYVADSLLAYYRRGAIKQASAVFRTRYQLARDYGLSDSDTAHLELGGLLAVAGNSGPTCFWMIHHAFSDPKFLDELRNDLHAAVNESTREGKRVCTFDFGLAKARCKLPALTFQEALRHHASGTTLREVLEDTTLKNGRYVLKKGAIVQVPAAVIHSNPSIWGEDVHAFRPQRFLGKQVAGSFRGFGGGASLCPGRHFAINEIVLIVSLMVLRYDLRPTNGHRWSSIGHRKGNMTTQVAWPATEQPVELIPRKGFEDVEWVNVLTDSENKFDISAIS